MASTEAGSIPEPQITVMERRVERRARLIAAAADVYGEAGFRHATVRMICKRARLTERYFYESFVSTEKLLVEAAALLSTRMFSHLATVRSSTTGDPRAILTRVLGGYFRALLHEASKARVFTLEIRGICAEADAELERILDTYSELIVDICDPGRNGPAARDRLLRRGIVGGVLQIAIAWIESEFSEPLDNVTGAAVSICGPAFGTLPAKRTTAPRRPAAGKARSVSLPAKRRATPTS